MAGASRPGVGREDRETTAVATAFFDDDIFGSDGDWKSQPLCWWYNMGASMLRIYPYVF